MSIATVGDHLVHYEALGRGKPLIFIHGWIGSWRYWWPSMQTLSAHFRTFALDLWGFGDSSRVSGKYTIAEYAALMEGFVERLGIAEPATIVGHGLGACVGLRYSARNPSGVARLAAVALPLTGESVNVRILKGERQAAVERLMELVHTFPEVDIEARKTDAAALSALARELDGLNTVEDLNHVACPLLMIYGDRDPLVQHPNGEYALEHVTSSDRALVTLESCMHFPMLEHSAKFDRLILDFVHADNDLRHLAPKEYWKRRTH